MRLSILVALCMLPVAAWAAADHSWPSVHLRTATIHTQTAPQGFSSPSYRRRLLQHNCHTEHAAWGVLHSAHQLLATHGPGLNHSQRLELLDHVERSGARVMGHLPDHTLLLVGQPRELELAASHAQFVWAGAHEPHYKVAPEWAPLLEQVAAAAAAAGLTGGSARRGGAAGISRGMGGAVNGTLLRQAQLAAALAQLPVRIAYRRGEWPRVGVRIAFPAAIVPQPHAPDDPHAERHAARAARVRRERDDMHAGSAAAADWAAPLAERFGAGTQVVSGGAHSAVVFAPAEHLGEVVSWLAERPAAHWVTPLPRHRLLNRQASCITQSGKPAPATGKIDLDPALHPLWAAGITGENQVIGIGDSGLDHNHCFFNDPAVNWNAGISMVEGRRTFSSTVHRKIRLYRGQSDFADANGHGTHVSGSLAGIPYGTTLEGDSKDYVGMAPGAKLAFIDLSAAGDGDGLTTPADLANEYFRFTTQVGASIHSDSWGGTSVIYDVESAQVDAYCWDNPTFLPVFPAGNDGSKRTNRGPGVSTVNSPATAKNCLAVGATQTTQETLDAGAAGKFTVWTAKAQSGDSMYTTFPALSASFGGSAGALRGGALPIVAAAPLEACATLSNSAALSGGVALVARGNCTFEEKARAAQAAGAAALLIFDNVLGPYFAPTPASASSSVITLPVMFIPRRVGQNLLAALTIGRATNVTFSAARAPSNGFENLASFSSQGPVGKDGRVKPDLVAPGTLVSAAANTACEMAVMGGTSMATPVVAGSATLLRQYFVDGFYPSGVATSGDTMDPTSALIKAVLVAGAVPLQGFEADTGLPIDPPPSARQGYGRVTLGQSVFLSGAAAGPKSLQVVDAVKINTGEVHQYCVTAGGGAITVALAWTDPAGSPVAARSLVNDLDLTVRAEGLNGVPVLGNGGGVDDSTQPDTVNNIEVVTLSEVPAGKVAIEVRGSDVKAAGGGQPYALVVNGDFSGALVVPADGNGECTVVTAVITGGPGVVTNQAAPQFTFSTQTGSSQGVIFECRMADSGGNVGGAGTSDWARCSSPASFASLPDGNFTFSVRAAGEKTSASRAFTKDTAPPQVQVAPGASPLQPGVAASAATSQPSASFAFTASDATAVTFACQLEVAGGAAQQAQPSSGSVAPIPVQLGSWFNCTSPQTAAWLLPGRWTFSVQGTDAAGNVAALAQTSWDVGFDPAKAYARVLSGPFLSVGSATGSFALAALSSSGSGGGVTQAAGAGLECSLVKGDAAATPSGWAACTTPFQFTVPGGDGSYKFAARVAGDSAAAAAAPGSLDPDTWAVSLFTVDTTPPAASITSGPANGSAQASGDVAFEFAVNEAGSSTTCSLSAGGATPSPSPCASPVTFTNLTDGRYTFVVTPRDAVGNTGAPLAVDFAVDTTPPNITDVQMPVATTTGNFNVTFAVTDGAAGSGVKSTSCRVHPVEVAPSKVGSVNSDDSRWTWAPCSSPWEVQGLVEGHWGVGLQAVDNAGLSATALERDVWVDTVAPVAQVSGAPAKNQVITGGTVSFNLSDASPAAATGSPVQWQALLNAITPEQYQAYTNGSAGSIGTGGGGAGDGSSTQSIKADAGAEQAAALGKGAVGQWTNCSAQCTFKGLAGGAYTFQARGIDAAGNSGPASAPYPLQVTGASSSGLPTWAIAVIAGVGGVAVILAVVAICCCCCRRRRAAAAARPPPGAISSSAAYAAYPPAAPYATNGWGGQQPTSYPPPPPAHYYQPTNGYGNGAAYTNGGAYNGYAPARAWQAGRAAMPPPQDPVEAQELALALAASERQARLDREAAQGAQAHVPRAVPPPAAAVDHDAELRAAIEASLREPRRPPPPPPPAAALDEEAQLRAALEASLREQQGRAPSPEYEAWPPTAPSDAGGSLVEWPPRR